MSADAKEEYTKAIASLPEHMDDPSWLALPAITTYVKELEKVGPRWRSCFNCFMVLKD